MRLASKTKQAKGKGEEFGAVRFADFPEMKIDVALRAQTDLWKIHIVDHVYASRCQVHVCKMHRKEEQAETEAEKEEEEHFIRHLLKVNNCQCINIDESMFAN